MAKVRLAPPGFGKIEGREPTRETVDDLIRVLRASWEMFNDETLSKIALDKLQGYINREITERHGMALRSVERKLQLIRRMLAEKV